MSLATLYPYACKGSCVSRILARLWGLLTQDLLQVYQSYHQTSHVGVALALFFKDCENDHTLVKITTINM